MIPLFESLFARQPFSLKQAEKERVLLPLLQSLTSDHKRMCPAYRQIVDKAFPYAMESPTLTDLPYLPVSIFRHRNLRSIPDSNVELTLLSRGTTSDAPNHVDLDAVTLRLTARAMLSTLQAVLGANRLPMLILEKNAGIKDQEHIDIRTALIHSLMSFGSNHAFALTPEGETDEKAIESFLSAHKGHPFFLFGFTDRLWQKFLPFCIEKGYDFSGGLLLHSGGWRKLSREYIDNETFSSAFKKATNVSRVVDIYGMVETPGVFFIENEDGLLYVPSFADVIIRDPIDFKPVENGTPGLIQIVSMIPHSFPGHSLLTEDAGIIEAVDTGLNGWQGKALRFLGRISKTAP